MGKIATLIYTKDGTPVSDFDLEATLEEIVRNGGTFYFSTENIFYLIRHGIATERFSHEDFTFIFNGEVIPINKYGAVVGEWTKGFMDTTMTLGEGIIIGAIKQRKKGK